LHISPNSSKAVKEWPLEHYVTLIGRIWVEHPSLQVVASGSTRPRERERLGSLEASVNDTRFERLPENLSIPQLAAALSRCLLHIGSDSGVLHLAFALNVPSISFLREQPNFGAFKPAGPRHQVLSMPCSCIDSPEAPCETLKRAECLARIQPERVAKLVDEQLKAWANL
jgi:heptosyltransferase-2